MRAFSVLLARVVRGSRTAHKSGMIFIVALFSSLLQAAQAGREGDSFDWLNNDVHAVCTEMWVQALKNGNFFFLPFTVDSGHFSFCGGPGKKK